MNSVTIVCSTSLKGSLLLSLMDDARNADTDWPGILPLYESAVLSDPE